MKTKEATLSDWLICAAFIVLNAALVFTCGDAGLSIPQFILWLVLMVWATPAAFRVGYTMKLNEHRLANRR